MLFNSYLYILCFLPLTVLGYFTLCRLKLTQGAKLWLVFASLCFYGYWNPLYILLILASIAANYAIGTHLQRIREKSKKLLMLGILFNVGLLCYFKYTDFFIENANAVLKTQIPLLHIALPLAISFFTFQQIAYLVDSYKSIVGRQDFATYCLFVTFFPQLIAGPIVHHKEMMPQFLGLRSKVFQWENLAKGLYVFFLGLFKKVMIADTLAVWADHGFAGPENLTLFAGWAASLSYTFQLYFDFSGYMDMAIGSALILNIKLPANFNSPYKALNIQDFWRRWHITLSRFLRDYIYIPLGGNRRGTGRAYLNVFLTFLVGGIWHGAGWTFFFWGVLHGLGALVHRAWSGFGFHLPKFFAWLLTFVFVVSCWVFFRADNMGDALLVLKSMAGLNGVALPAALESSLGFLKHWGVTFGAVFLDLITAKAGRGMLIAMLPACLVIAARTRNTMQRLESFRPSLRLAFLASAATITGLVYTHNPTVFLYFQF